MSQFSASYLFQKLKKKDFIANLVLVICVEEIKFRNGE